MKNPLPPAGEHGFALLGTQSEFVSDGLNNVDDAALGLRGDAFLSLTDFQDGPAEYLFFPKDGESKQRSPEIWQRGDYEQLSGGQLNDCIEMFLEARDEARRILMEEWHRHREQSDATAAAAAEMGDLFAPKK